jgi:aspartyl-tRNA(Asn)/glutamyl-tRNA(Gln) amidotransferase subunit A
MEPWQLGVLEAAAAIKAGTLSPTELADSLLARIEDCDGPLVAWVTVDAEGARAAARQTEARLARGEALGPLAGVPIGVKDVIDVAGLPTTASSKVLAGHMAAEDAACILGGRGGVG